MKWLSWLLACMLMAGCAVSQTAPPPPGRVPASVLFVGNSYSFKVPGELRRLAARNGMNLRVGQVTHGGWTLARHASDAETLRVIREGGWDVVVLQEQSRIPSLPLRRIHAMFPAVRQLAHEARSRGAVPVLYQTWGRRDGDPLYARHDDFSSMNRRLREGYRAASHAAGGLEVVAVGDAWEREVAAGRGAALFMTDGSHPTPEGNRLAARVFFDSLFRRAR